MDASNKEQVNKGKSLGSYGIVFARSTFPDACPWQKKCVHARSIANDFCACTAILLNVLSELRKTGETLYHDR